MKNKGKREDKEKREGEKKKTEMVTVERRCVDFIAAESFDIFSQGEDFGELWCFLG